MSTSWRIGLLVVALGSAALINKGWRTSSRLREECEGTLAGELRKNAASIEQVEAASLKLAESKDAGYLGLQQSLRSYWFDLKSLRDRIPSLGCGNRYFTRSQALMNLIADTRQLALDRDPRVSVAPLLSQGAWLKSGELAESCCSRFFLLVHPR
jgi:hypothetical protein